MRVLSEAEFSEQQSSGQFDPETSYADYLAMKYQQLETAKRSREKLSPLDRADLEARSPLPEFPRNLMDKIRDVLPDQAAA
ncbi:MAG: hypothetical protein U0Z53_23680 [Blastocatellia bacterium]